MQNLIDGKLKEIREVGVANRELRSWIDRSNLWYWIYSVMQAEGSRIERSKIVDILDGKIVENAQLEDYRFILGYDEAYKDMRSCIQMDQDADEKHLMRWAEMLLGREVEFRRGNPVIYEWNHIPPVAADSERSTCTILKGYAFERRKGASVRNIALMHLEFLRLYPFDRDSIRIAGLLTAYSLLREGYPLPGLSLGDIEYNKMIDGYVNRRETEEFVGIFERSVLNRLESVLQICRQAAELDDK